MQLNSDIAAIVTGGASGLGEATARMLAHQGVRVTIFDMNEEKGQVTAGDIGGTFVPVDVTDAASVEAGVEKARAAHGVERILVNCAGIALGRKTLGTDRKTGELKAHDMASFRKVVEVNLIGTYQMIAQSVPEMSQLQPITADGCRGVIVMTSSVAATDGQIGQAAYAASKGGVLGMTLPVARDLTEYGIRVCAIQPGVFETPMVSGMPEKVRESLAAGVPFPKRLGQAHEYAHVVKFICENDYMNGESIRLDGAIRLAPR
ncbi:SDR family NAD(P)-dependent oxidoreductase [Afifella sp. H1R]|uniref:SDR family NAD(P)-dependent oxidoreductase n=1 Tax=unclassified Afifella TaxID=2624128 RepID=UPI001F1F3CAC|nr:SDR family NAD(P)-dependent oxidoreductase [Afifella sp. H1R]MCF1505272.1 SDR family NAD(P)-dependent oxidoreductase [Afifella sp. H1R]